MKKEIRIMLDYQCYPIWIYDEAGNFIDNDMPEEIQENCILVKKIEEIQDIFDSLYVNNNTEFKYIGFVSDGNKRYFEDLVRQIYQMLHESLSEKYVVKNLIDVSKM